MARRRPGTGSDRGWVVSWVSRARGGATSAPPRSFSEPLLADLDVLARLDERRLRGRDVPARDEERHGLLDRALPGRSGRGPVLHARDDRVGLPLGHGRLLVVGVLLTAGRRIPRRRVRRDRALGGGEEVLPLGGAEERQELLDRVLVLRLARDPERVSERLVDLVV